MKLYRILCLLFALLLSATLCVTSVAAENSEESAPADTGTTAGFTVSYGYKPLVASNGVSAARYVKGTTPPSEKVPAGGSHTVADNEYKFRDYIFAGWSCNGKIYRPGEVIYNIQSDMKLIATWRRCPVDGIKVVGVLSYGDTAVNVTVGETVTLKEGLWKSSDGKILSGGSRFLMSFTTVKLEKIDVAEAESFKVSYNGNGAQGGTQCEFRVLADGSFKVDGCYGQRDGYKFIGWQDGEGRVYLAGDTCIVKGDTVLTANWQESSKPAPDYCSVSLSAGEGGTITPDGKTTVLKGDTVEFTVSASKGYKLSSVICDGEELGTGGTYKKTVNADMTVTAKFEYVGGNEVSTESSVQDESSAEDSSVTESQESSKPEEESDDTSVAESQVTSEPDDTDKDDDGGDRKVLIILICVLFIVAGGWFAAISVLNKKKKNKKKK